MNESQATTKSPTASPTVGPTVNPKVREVQIGIRKFRTIQFYPLSVYSESQMIDVINEFLAEIRPQAGGEAMSDIEVVNRITLLIKRNLSKILEYATGEEDGEGILKETDNDQFIEIVDAIFDQNFSSSVKNGKDLFEKIRPMFFQTPPTAEIE